MYFHYLLYEHKCTETNCRVDLDGLVLDPAHGAVDRSNSILVGTITLGNLDIVHGMFIKSAPGKQIGFSLA